MHCRGLRMGHQSIQVSGEADLSSRADLCCSYPLQLISYPLQLNILPPCSAPTSSTNCTPAKFLYKYLWNIPATYLIKKSIPYLCCFYSRDFTFYHPPKPPNPPTTNHNPRWKYFINPHFSLYLSKYPSVSSIIHAFQTPTKMQNVIKYLSDIYFDYSSPTHPHLFPYLLSKYLPNIPFKEFPLDFIWFVL